MLNVNDTTYDRILTHTELPVVHLTLVTPIVLSDIKDAHPRAIRRINAFYAHMAQAITRHAERVLKPSAGRSLASALGRSRGFEPWRVKLSFVHEQPEDGGELVLTHTLYANLGGDERERCFVTVWDTHAGLVLRTVSAVPAPPPW